MIRAIHFSDRDTWLKAEVPGSFSLSGNGGGKYGFWYYCPCGCGIRARILVGDGFKPPKGTSWNWNGSLSEPTLNPSINHVGHWHGWLRDGYWEVC
ncbi:hypothetical protein KX928_12670 [Roseobacter sp. YSTF-M11]|uniref:Uncharacterized protein n=1 Tax=Roseobacter insulae TaxID=2859783 RepID=A0A9X1FXC6_9RHOB|nr:DUF6527 family protein [Roseobacter insulae]MBW4708638.1 hypothetical protein [Roseobacter insulae]